MAKKIISISILLVICIALFYSIYSHIKEREIINSGYLNEDLFLQLAKQSSEQKQEAVAVEDVELHGVEEKRVDEHNHTHEENEPDVMVVAGQAINFSLTTLDGEKVKLSDLLGKKVFINFWATWCPPCEEEMPHIEKYYEIYAEKHNVVILGVNTTDLEGDKDSIRKFIQEHEISFPILLDETGDVSKQYGILTLPTSMIIDENGMIEEQIIGPVTEEMLLEKLGQEIK
ncbi:peroxiredoxin [Ureibacillus xyleni]|uniref:Peroxiredoxin n=1 Tax=Ureibacillus xyleni TaxID=614648 RepID=A0A285RJD0_9BACL|nr:TlpA disulfide reductase family protein [Ureibacillus xyleni]SOB94235.1 peroxiredoxin [Ureibacillus xyleni]